MKEPFIYLFTQTGCLRCPEIKMRLLESLEGANIQTIEMNIDEVSEDLDYALLENQIFLREAPTAVLVYNTNEEVPQIDMIKIPEVILTSDHRTIRTYIESIMVGEDHDVW